MGAIAAERCRRDQGAGALIRARQTDAVRISERGDSRGERGSVPVSNPQLPPDFEGKQSAWQEDIEPVQ